MFKDLTKLIPLLLLSGGLGFTSCLSMGCISDLSNHGEAGIRFGNEITFFARASKTSDEHAVASIDFKPTADLVKSLRESEAESDGE